VGGDGGENRPEKSESKRKEWLGQRKITEGKRRGFYSLLRVDRALIGFR